MLASRAKGHNATLVSSRPCRGRGRPSSCTPRSSRPHPTRCVATPVDAAQRHRLRSERWPRRCTSARSRKDHRIHRTVADSSGRPELRWTIWTDHPYRTGLSGLGWTHWTVSNRLKPPRGKPHAGSNPAPGTTSEQAFCLGTAASERFLKALRITKRSQDSESGQRRGFVRWRASGRSGGV